MFVRALWRNKPWAEVKRNLREIDVPFPRDADMLGLYGRDFDKMTRGLFDR